MGKKLHEIEIQRRNVSPREFWTYCNRESSRRLGFDLIADFVESYDDFIDPAYPSNVRTRDEYCVVQPFNWHMYSRGAYNFIMEFEFDDEKRGHGYLYIVEFDVNE